MYSKKNMRENFGEVPPFYSGTRFEKHLGTDGREEYSLRNIMPFESASRSIQKKENENGVKSEIVSASDVPKEVSEYDSPAVKSNLSSVSTNGEKAKSGGISDFFSKLGSDDLLIIAIIILLASEEEDSREIILLLVFLLVAGR